MCSTDRKEIEGLKSELFRAGIRSEICSNPVAAALGITRLEISIYDSDLIEAARIHKEFLQARDGEAGTGGGINGVAGMANHHEVELAVERPRVPVRAQLAAPGQPGQAHADQPDSYGSNLAQAAVLLEKEVEEVLAHDHRLAKECAALEHRVKALEGSLAQAQAELSRESSGKLAAEQKLAEASATRGSLEKQLGDVELRLKTAEQSLSAAQGRLESQARELKCQQIKVGDLNKEVASRDGQLGMLAESLAQSRGALENEKGLREVAEQIANEQAAARKLLEQKVKDCVELQAQLEEQNRREREHMQAYLDAVNKLRSRLSQKRSEHEAKN